MGRLTTFVLPYPPSINRYWRRVGERTVLSREGRRYREEVSGAVAQHGVTFDGAVAVDVLLYPPDRRRRDIDNTLKALLDGLAHAGVYLDDSQVRSLSIERRGVVTGGRVILGVREWPSFAGIRNRP